MEEKGIENFVKYPGYYKEQKNKPPSKKPFHASTLYYHEAENYFICPMGQKMNFLKTEKRKTKTGFEQTVHKYQAINCANCPLRSVCHQAATNRIIEVNWNSRKYRQQARDNLSTLRGKRMKIQRNVDVEAVFGHIKQDRQFRRFTMRGLDGVKTEFGLLALAHNFKKWHAYLNSRGRVVFLNPKNSPNRPQNTQKFQKRA